MPTRRLPPLRALEAFVRVVRLGSAKAAADELALSPSALSRRVASLEEYTGKRRFEKQFVPPNNPPTYEASLHLSLFVRLQIGSRFIVQHRLGRFTHVKRGGSCRTGKNRLAQACVSC